MAVAEKPVVDYMGLEVQQRKQHLKDERKRDYDRHMLEVLGLTAGQLRQHEPLAMYLEQQNLHVISIIINHPFFLQLFNHMCIIFVLQFL